MKRLLTISALAVALAGPALAQSTNEILDRIINQQLREFEQNSQERRARQIADANKVWLKPRAYAGEFEATRYQCLQDAASVPVVIGGVLSPNYQMAVACLEAHGWRLGYP